MTAFAVATSFTDARGEDRLMPSSDVAQVRMQLHVDGNVILVTLKNDSHAPSTPLPVSCHRRRVR